MDSSKYKPFDQLTLRQKGAGGDVFAAGDGVCMMRFYYKMWGSLHMGQLQLYMVTKGSLYNTKREVWKTRGTWKYYMREFLSKSILSATSDSSF